jgi:glycosyltransferase involved in cell wall biosynthesis
VEDRWVLQFCHCHYGPFLDVARQYAVLFNGTPYKVLTVYLTGEDTPEARSGSVSDEVMFLNFRSKDVGGLKLAAIRALKQILASREFALIIAHRFKPIYIACLASKTLPVIGVHHAFGDYIRYGRRAFARLFQQRLWLLAVSNAVRDDIRACLPNWPTEKIQTLYNRINPAELRAEQLPRDAARAALKLPENAYIIGNVGRLHPDKDQATLIRGFALARQGLPNESLLVILGTGELEAELKALAKTLGVDSQVRFLGQTPQARRYFRAFDVFALTSDREPFGMVLLEAMAADLPLIVSNCGGAPEIVARQGDLFALGDAEQLATCLSRMPRPVGQNTRIYDFSDAAIRNDFWQIMQRVLPVPGTP